MIHESAEKNSRMLNLYRLNEELAILHVDFVGVFSFALSGSEPAPSGRDSTLDSGTQYCFISLLKVLCSSHHRFHSRQRRIFIKDFWIFYGGYPDTSLHSELVFGLHYCTAWIDRDIHLSDSENPE